MLWKEELVLIHVLCRVITFSKLAELLPYSYLLCLLPRHKLWIYQLKEMTMTHPNQSPHISISHIILAKTWRSVAFPSTRETRKAVKI